MLLDDPTFATAFQGAYGELNGELKPIFGNRKIISRSIELINDWKFHYYTKITHFRSFVYEGNNSELNTKMNIAVEILL